MKKQIRLLSLLSAILICLSLSGCKNESQGSAKTEKDPASSSESDINGGNIKAVITVEGYGDIKLELDSETAPITVANFVKLANDGFYDGLTFHRSISQFMIQGGDPKADGTGGSEKTIKGEFSQNGVQNNISHTRGTISMARRSNDFDSASSQFFIVQKDSTFLDGGYAAFGHVTEGMEIIDKMIANTPVTDADSGLVEKSKQPVISSVKILE